MNPFDSIRAFFVKERDILRFIREGFGFFPRNLSLYKLALCHKSAAKEQIKGVLLNNERLEFLGDAVLGLIIADYLFKKYPLKDEGFLTEIRSRIVNRSQLNQLAVLMGLDKHIQSGHNGSISRNVYGNTLEAFVGAMYLDKGYKACRNILINKILEPHIDLETLVQENLNYKSRLVEWAQKEKHTLEYRLVSEKDRKGIKQFCVELYIDRRLIAHGKDSTIKGAEQLAAARAIEIIGSAVA